MGYKYLIGFCANAACGNILQRIPEVLKVMLKTTVKKSRRMLWRVSHLTGFTCAPHQALNQVKQTILGMFFPLLIKTGKTVTFVPNEQY